MVNLTVDVSDDQRARLKSVLGPAADLDDVLGYVLLAGAREALAYATGEALFSSITDLRMYRVFRLIEAGLPPGNSEQVVAALFKVPLPTARRLIATAFARYSVELNERIAEEVKGALDKARSASGKKWEISLPAGFIKDAILSTCRASTQSDPTSVKGSVWAFPEETYDFLRSNFDMPARPWTEPIKKQ
ncbi:hypothetical protein GCM10009867_22450 [Pedococcus aerophilus]|uniref:Uncharacterized protein n=1 Tax=Pedococcus aerophilus TaxID=436356 RepID=A0ABP6H6A0_9MICO